MRLEDIDKQNIFKVPDGYFDQLPTKIQSRINDSTSSKSTLNWNLFLKIATPAFVVVLLFIFINKNHQKPMPTAGDYLAQVSTDDLIAYLGTTEISADEILEELDMNENYVDLFDDETPILEFELNDKEINAVIDAYGINGEVL